MIFPLPLITGVIAAPLIATATLSFGLGAAAVALAPGKNRASRPQQGPRRPPVSPEPSISQLRETLRLNSKQDTLWHHAEKADWEANGQALERLRVDYEKTLALLNEPGIDLPSVAMRMESFRAAEQQLHDTRRERWKTLFEALDAGQQEKIRPFFRRQVQS